MRPIAAIITLLLLFPSAVLAETKEIVSEGTYNMGDGETPSVAESRALLKAKQIAVEQAGTYVESYSKVKNLTLTQDEIQVLASGLMEVEILDKKRTVVGDGINFWVKIKAKVNPDKMEEMAKRVKEKSVVEDYKRIQETYANSQKEIVQLKKELVQAKEEKEKKKVEAKISKEEILFQADEWYSKGYEHSLNNKLDEAILAFTVAIKLNPRDYVAYHDRGETYLRKHLYDMAIADFSRSLTEATSAHEISLELGNQWPGPFFKKIFSYNYNNRGAAYYKKGQADLAKEDFDKAIAIDPDDTAAYFNRGKIYLNEKAYDKAIANYSKAIDLGRKDVEMYKGRAAAYAAAGQYGKAIEDLSLVMSISPDYLTLSTRGALYFTIAQYDKAIDDLNKAINLNPSSSDYSIYSVRGSSYLNIAQYDRAIDDFNKAIKLNPSKATSYLYRGNAYSDKALSDAHGDNANLDKALSDYNRALVINKNLFEGYQKRGIVYSLLDKRDKAIEDFTKAISLNPDDAITYVARGKMYENGGQYDKALEDYNKVIVLNPKLAEIYAGRGEFYQKIGENTKALADFKKACNMGYENGCKLLQHDIQK